MLQQLTPAADITVREAIHLGELDWNSSLLHIDSGA